MESSLVGSLAAGLAVVTAAVAIGPWQRPFDLRTLANVTDRYGDRAARWLLVFMALFMGTTAAAILCGWRPAYARSIETPQTLEAIRLRTQPASRIQR